MNQRTKNSYRDANNSYSSRARKDFMMKKMVTDNIKYSKLHFNKKRSNFTNMSLFDQNKLSQPTNFSPHNKVQKGIPDLNSKIIVQRQFDSFSSLENRNLMMPPYQEHFNT